MQNKNALDRTLCLFTESEHHKAQMSIIIIINIDIQKVK